MNQMLHLLLSVLVVFVAGCQKDTHRSVGELVTIPEGQSTILITGPKDLSKIKQQAQSLGLTTSGDAVVSVSGNQESLSELNVGDLESLSVLVDEQLIVSGSNSEQSMAAPDERIYYLAQKELGVVDFLRENPTFDGRGISVGVIDDGISAHLSGFKTTSDGRRKFVNRFTVSTLLTIPVTSASIETLSGFARTTPHEGSIVSLGVLDERLRNPFDQPTVTGFDANRDGTLSSMEVVVLEKGEQITVCVDVNLSSIADTGECFGTFNSTGEYGFWNVSKAISVQAEFDRATRTVKLSPGEGPEDSHGEGVASVLAGHKIAGRFNGVAPGAQIFDYDFSTNPGSFNEGMYTVSSILNALEYLGSNGVGVANLSYSIFFESAATQSFMQVALERIVQRYNIVISFSAGNNGPGLGSLNRRGMYSESVLVAGAFVGRELDEYVHGATGLPEQGRVIRYSSRGPGPEGGFGPVVISPLASLTHSSTGFSAFSGTSSASPALAGTAAVLMSAISQLGLRVDAATVVHALRASAKPLSNVPFVDQGYGMPNVGRALEIYKKMMVGDLFIRTTSVMSESRGPDGVEARGLFFRTSEGLRSHESTVILSGIPSRLVSPLTTVEMLSPILLEYSHPWIRGPSRLWMATTRSSFSLSVDFEEMRRSVGNLDEVNGEVYIIDERSGIRIHTIPITVIQPRTLNRSHEIATNISSEEGLRTHFFAPDSLKGIWLQTTGSNSYLQTLNVRVYDSSGKIIFSKSGREIRNAMIPFFHKGHTQIAFSRSRGTQLDMRVEAKITPINFSVASEAVNRLSPAVTLDHNLTPIFGTLTAVQSPTIVSESYTRYTSAVGIVSEVLAETSGTYRLTARLTVAPEMSYPYINCSTTLTDTSGNLVSRSNTDSITVREGQTGKIKFLCYPFDHVIGATHTIDYLLKIIRTPITPVDELSLSTMIDSGRTTHELRPLSPIPAGRRYDLLLRSVGGTGEIVIGNFLTY